MLVDIILTWSFAISHLYFFVAIKFNSEADHVLQLLIGVGFTGTMIVYAYTDAARFLRSNFDKILYLISCLVFQKPLFLPVMLPWRFRSRIAKRHIPTHSVTL